MILLHAMRRHAAAEVSHHMNLDDAPRGHDMVMRKQDDVMKTVLRA